MKKLDESAEKADSGDLEFPDGSGMDNSSARISPDVAIRLCEQYRAWLPEREEQPGAQRPEKGVVEFVL